MTTPEEQRLIRQAEEERDMELFRARVAQRQVRLEETRQRYATHTTSPWKNLVWLGFAFLVIAALIMISYFFW